MELLEKFLIAVGGGATALVVVLTVFKSMFLKIFEKAMDTTFEKNIEKYRNKLSRSTTAYELLLKKEFEFYDKIDPNLATLVPLVQDLVYYARGNDGIDEPTQCKEYKEHLMTYLKMIPEMKNEILLHQSYIPQNVFEAASALILEMQKELDFWKEVVSLFGENGSAFDEKKAEEISNAVLMCVASIEVAIKQHLTELSEA